MTTLKSIKSTMQTVSAYSITGGRYAEPSVRREPEFPGPTLLTQSISSLNFTRVPV